jgi:ubiquinone/menaquinone biosynthesis C-methylase UbiE
MKTDVEKWLTKDGKTFLKGIGIKKGHVVLDFGCSVGHYTIPVAKVVGEEGKVYAVDKDREALTQLMQIAKSEGLKNIEPMKTQGELKIKLEDEYVDVVLLYDILHYINREERKELYNDIYRILKIDGLLSIYPKHHKFDEPFWELADTELESLVKEIESANFCLHDKKFKKLIHDINYDKGYILNFTPSDKP